MKITNLVDNGNICYIDPSFMLHIRSSIWTTIYCNTGFELYREIKDKLEKEIIIEETRKSIQRSIQEGTYEI